MPSGVSQIRIRGIVPMEEYEDFPALRTVAFILRIVAWIATAANVVVALVFLWLLTRVDSENVPWIPAGHRGMLGNGR